MTLLWRPVQDHRSDMIPVSQWWHCSDAMEEKPELNSFSQLLWTATQIKRMAFSRHQESEISTRVQSRTWTGMTDVIFGWFNEMKLKDMCSYTLLHDPALSIVTRFVVRFCRSGLLIPCRGAFLATSTKNLICLSAAQNAIHRLMNESEQVESCAQFCVCIFLWIMCNKNLIREAPGARICCMCLVCIAIVIICRSFELTHSDKAHIPLLLRGSLSIQCKDVFVLAR